MLNKKNNIDEINHSASVWIFSSFHAKTPPNFCMFFLHTPFEGVLCCLKILGQTHILGRASLETTF